MKYDWNMAGFVDSKTRIGPRHFNSPVDAMVVVVAPVVGGEAPLDVPGRTGRAASVGASSSCQNGQIFQYRKEWQIHAAKISWFVLKLLFASHASRPAIPYYSMCHSFQRPCGTCATKLPLSVRWRSPQLAHLVHLHRQEKLPTLFWTWE